MAAGPYRARIYAVRYVLAFSVLAITLPLVAIVYESWGFDTLFLILASAALIILMAAVFGNLSLLILDPLTILYRTLTSAIWPGLDSRFPRTGSQAQRVGLCAQHR